MSASIAAADAWDATAAAATASVAVTHGCGFD